MYKIYKCKKNGDIQKQSLLIVDTKLNCRHVKMNDLKS